MVEAIRASKLQNERGHVPDHYRMPPSKFTDPSRRWQRATQLSDGKVAGRKKTRKPFALGKAKKCCCKSSMSHLSAQHPSAYQMSMRTTKLR